MVSGNDKQEAIRPNDIDVSCRTTGALLFVIDNEESESLDNKKRQERKRYLRIVNHLCKPFPW